MEKNMTICVVEDDQTDFDHIIRAIGLISPQLQVRRFLHGAALLNYLSQAVPGAYPSLIILDFYLPVFDGLKTLRRLKENETVRQIPVLMWSGSSRSEDISQAYRLGAGAFHTKPDLFEDWEDLMRVTLRYWLSTVQLPLSPGY
ncbi:response regulator [Larkinella soli]|uniref:response regulator n=1 Tax=Larkinella soli TaxID=1770527 RepID=UPI000FFC0258|nr:response regulator [Larkinella soli]